MKKVSDRNSFIHIIIILLAGIITIWYTYEEKVELLGDNAYYYILGKSIASGEGYVDISQPAQPKNNHYPPGYPALISPVIFLFGDSIQPVKIFNCLLLLGSLVLVYLLTSGWINRVAAFVVTLFCVVNSHLLFYSSIMMSEIPYLFFSLLTLYLFSRSSGSFFWKDKYMYLTLLALVFTYYIRALGVALLIGMVIHLIIHKQWKQLIFYSIGLFLLVIPWNARSSSLGGSSYINQLKMVNPYQPGLGEAGIPDYLTRIGENLERYITKEIPSAFYPAFEVDYQQPGGAGSWLFGIILIGIGLYGCWLNKSYRFLLLGYLLATFGILMLWPQVWFGVRFIVPLAPIFYLALASVISVVLHEKLKLPMVSWHYFLLLIFIFPLLPSVKTLHDESRSQHHPAWRSYFAAADWIRKNSPEGSVVSTGKPSLFYLYAERPVVRYLFTQDAEELLAHLEKSGVDYVIIDQVYGNTLRYLLPVVQGRQDRFEFVYQIKNPDTYILKLKK